MSGRSMAGAIRVQTRPGRGRSPNAWYGGGSQAASMAGPEAASSVDLAQASGNPGVLRKSNPGEPGVTGRHSPRHSGIARAPGTKGAVVPAPPVPPSRSPAGSPGPVRGGRPGNPGVTSAAAQRGTPRPSVTSARSTGKNPGETAGSRDHRPAGSNVTQRSPLNKGSAAQDDMAPLITLAGKIGAKMTLGHLQAAQVSASHDDYSSAVTHLNRAHDTARGEGSVQLMNVIQQAIRQQRSRSGKAAVVSP